MSLFSKEELRAFLEDSKTRLQNDAKDEKELQKLTRREFLKWLNDFIEPLKDQIAANASLPTQFKEERVKRALKDFDFFRRTYFPHYYSMPGKSDLQEYLESIYYHIRDKDKKAIGEKFATAAPRGYGKSTDASVIFPIWCIVYGIKHFITIFSDAVELTETLIEAIKAELEENKNLKQDFPEATGIGKIWRVGEIVTKNNIKVKGFGSGKRVRGIKHGVYRPDLVIIDDLENDENVRSLKQRDKLEEWLDSAIDNLGSVDGKMDIIYIGTILHRDSVLARKLKLAFWHPKTFKALISYPDRMDLWDIYENLYRRGSPDAAHEFYLKHKEDMDKGARVLWEAVSLEVLMQKRAANPRAFEREQQNNPGSENQTFDSSRFEVISKTQMPKLYKKFIYTDFKGDSTKGDYFAVVAGGLGKEKDKLYVYYSKRARIKGKKAVEFLIDLEKKERFYLVGGEKNGGFYLYRDWFKDMCINRLGYIPNTKFIHNTQSKEERIAELEFPITDKDIVFVGEHPELFRELEDFPQSQYDDLSDALAGLWRLCRLKKNQKRRKNYAKKFRRRREF
ncbi:hypothetical protein RZR97_08265 [Hydrogenimonas thermophila]|uniref:hypothetical protein n=1 Tax=Hydrogenimonas thermophila TaxID=223786 RepID=UPI0029370BB6|nr:hypothetical protein [Hydrogenimonas thermophila]WOE69101.1 hypothetical protein RZR91_08290 [Hydrogenimonas thermophila]WOE71611.1 hypothetical protein RZR97_08265 [Hydrogenimonas thermophila]